MGCCFSVLTNIDYEHAIMSASVKSSLGIQPFDNLEAWVS
jgi:hypothetical protein